MSLINLGNVVLEDFEVPGSVEFGGKQRVIVHKLIGGSRIIDAMGRDDAVLHWRGVLSGSDASERARTLDAMRAAGDLQSLSWDAFCYAVVVSDLRLSFRSPWWIPYEIQCTVQQDLAFSPLPVIAPVIGSIVDDLTQVTELARLPDLVDVQAISTLLSSGSTGQQQAISSASQVRATVSQSIVDAEKGFASSDIGLLVSSAGSLATLCCAQGYLERSEYNMNNLGV